MDPASPLHPCSRIRCARHLAAQRIASLHRSARRGWHLGSPSYESHREFHRFTRIGEITKILQQPPQPLDLPHVWQKTVRSHKRGKPSGRSRNESSLPQEQQSPRQGCASTQTTPFPSHLQVIQLRQRPHAGLPAHPRNMTYVTALPVAVEIRLTGTESERQPPGRRYAVSNS